MRFVSIGERWMWPRSVAVEAIVAKMSVSMSPGSPTTASSDDLYRSALALRELIEQHCARLARMCGAGAGDGRPFACPFANCPHRRRFRCVLREVIEELEESRKKFKSRQLEQLRKRLLALLAEES